MIVHFLYEKVMVFHVLVLEAPVAVKYSVYNTGENEIPRSV